MTHRYVGPSIRVHGVDGIRKNARVKIVGKQRGGLTRVRAKEGGQYLVSKRHLEAL